MIVHITRGELSLRLAETADEIRACQRLRYRIFYEELAAHPTAETKRTRLDADRFDAICDHLLVILDNGGEAAAGTTVKGGQLVGTYRLLRQAVAEANGGFYTQDEFDIAPLIARHPDLRFLELGRSCVLAPYRTKPVVELLWQGIWDYVRAHHLDVMFGCASLEGADPAAHQPSLAFLASQFRAPEEWRVVALPSRRAEMPAVPQGHIDHKQALRALPPLIKGYLRLGCYIGDGAVIDHQFDTTDVLIVLPVANINPRYLAHFGQPAETAVGAAVARGE